MGLGVEVQELFEQPASANLKSCNQERQQNARDFRGRLQPVLDGMLVQGLSRRAIVERLNDLGIKAPRGGAWSLGQVQRICAGK